MMTRPTLDVVCMQMVSRATVPTSSVIASEYRFSPRAIPESASVTSLTPAVPHGILIGETTQSHAGRGAVSRAWRLGLEELTADDAVASVVFPHRIAGASTPLRQNPAVIDVKADSATELAVVILALEHRPAYLARSQWIRMTSSKARIGGSAPIDSHSARPRTEPLPWALRFIGVLALLTGALS